MHSLDRHTLGALNFHAKNLAKLPEFQCSLISYIGPIHPAYLPQFLEFVESVAAKRKQTDKPDRVLILLSTPGGVVETVEKMVEIVRHFYQEVLFIVPVAAMSAGTVFCMSGDKIFMDFASSLGPIDPQVQGPDGRFVPALGYLDKVNELIFKSKFGGGLSDAEYVLIRALDLATLRRYEQARDLSINLLKEWLVKYKFKDWTTHATTNPGSPVTQTQKEQRAEEIAKVLCDNNTWHSHGRFIGINKLTGLLKLKIEDYTNNENLRTAVRTYSELLEEFFAKSEDPIFLHTLEV